MNAFLTNYLKTLLSYYYLHLGLNFCRLAALYPV